MEKKLHKIITTILISLSFLAVKAQTTGDLDTSFAPNPGTDQNIRTITLQADGKVIIGGAFAVYDGTAREKIARVNADGSLDATFDPGTGATGGSQVLATEIQPDGKILIGGDFSFYNGTARENIALLNTNGTLNPTFNPGIGPDDEVRKIILQPDGKILICGAFTHYMGTPRNYIARLNADGTLDTSFDPGTGASFNVQEMALQPDGKIIIGGYFSSYNGTARNKIARINTDGSLDTSFDPGTGANSTVFAIAIQPDGKILIGGGFWTFNGNNSDRIARLNTDGSVDASYTVVPGTNGSGDINDIALFPNGKIMIGGNFSSFNGYFLNSIACLNSDGTNDATFNPGSGADGTIYGLTLQPDGKTIIVGGFFDYNGTVRQGIARLHGACVAPTQPSITGNAQICTGQTTSLTAHAQFTSLSTTYTWTYPDNTTALGQNSGVISLPGTYSCAISNGTGCATSTSQVLSINPSNFNPDFIADITYFSQPPFTVQFTNQTANAGNYSFTWYFGNGSSTDALNTSYTYTSAGVYSVALIATDTSTGCQDAYYKLNHIICTYSAGDCNFTVNTTPSGTIAGCIGGSQTFTCATSAANPNYQWLFNGIPIGGAVQSEYTATTAGDYAVVVFNNDYSNNTVCPDTSATIHITFSSPTPPVPTITQTGGSVLPCSQWNMQLTATATGNPSSLLWTTGATTQNIAVNQSGDYFVTAFYGNGCESISLPYVINNSSATAVPSICMVSVDSAVTVRNRIIWEGNAGEPIDSFYIYRQTNQANVYAKVGAVAYEDLSEFTDEGSNAMQQAYRYKIAALDTCGELSSLSDMHRTIHLQVFPVAGSPNNRNLSWNHYEGIVGFPSYEIWRKQPSDPDFIQIDTVASNESTYTDFTSNSPNAEYQVRILLAQSCISVDRAAYGKSRSNVGNNQSGFITVGLNEQTGISNIGLYPNPSNGTAQLVYESDYPEMLQLDVVNVLGQQLLKQYINTQKGINRHTIDMEQKGVYFINLTDHYKTKLVMKMVVK